MTTLQLHMGRLDLGSGVLRGESDERRLTPIERKLVAHLADRRGAPVSREELQQVVWGYRPGILTRTVFTTVGRIRAKIERDPGRPDHLVTVTGLGYALRVEGDAPGPRPSVEVPTSRTPLIGREAELATLTSTLAGGARLLSLHGPGGVGKTRLAVELLRRAPGGLPGAFVPLEGCDDLTSVARAIAAALDVELGGGPDPLGEVGLALSDEPRLLVLDNVEHLMPDVAALIGDLLAGTVPGVRIVVTTRSRLGLGAEHVFRVEDLDVPEDGDALETADAGRLMLQAAGRARVGWHPDAAAREGLAEACRMVGGSPLAIELLASWLRLLDPEDLVAELRRSDEVLRASERDLPARHESIAVALEASCRLLDAPGAALLARLAVFHGPFDRALASEVAGATLTTLGQLVDAALLHRVDRGFDLHPLVRRFARARLSTTSDGGAALRDRHRTILLARLEDAFARRHAEPRWTEHLRPVRAEVLEAWSHAARARDRDAIAAHAVALVTWLDGLHEPNVTIDALGAAAAALEPRDPLAAALRLLTVGAGGPIPEPLDDLVERASALPGPLGILSLTHGAIGSHAVHAPEAGLEWAREAIARADALEPEDPFLRLFPRGVGGSLLLRLGRLDDARTWLQDALSRGASFGVSRTLVHLGQVELARGEADAAREALSRAIERLRAEGDRGFLVMGLTSLAAAEQAVGADPEPILREALEEAVRSRLPPVWYAGALIHLASRHAEAGSREQAARLLHAVDPSDVVLPEHEALRARTAAAVEAALRPDVLAQSVADARALAADPRALLSM